MKRGFTLVELAIVLVIIGLIIAGILVAQSMMDTARITKQVRQFEQFDIAVSNFRTQYGGLPGDAPAFGGDGNGVLDILAGSPTLYKGEFTNFWPQLASTGMLGPGASYTNSYSTPVRGGKGWQLPLAILPPTPRDPADSSSGGDGPLGVYAYGATDNINYYSIANQARSNNLLDGWTALAPATLAALDKKMDDGNGKSGKVAARKYGVGNLNDPGYDTTTNRCIDGAGKYLVSNTTPSLHIGCFPRIEMLSTGETQP